jgi:hypothetical protein
MAALVHTVSGSTILMQMNWLDSKPYAVRSIAVCYEVYAAQSVTGESTRAGGGC